MSTIDNYLKDSAIVENPGVDTGFGDDTAYATPTTLPCRVSHKRHMLRVPQGDKTISSAVAHFKAGADVQQNAKVTIDGDTYVAWELSNPKAWGKQHHLRVLLV